VPAILHPGAGGEKFRFAAPEPAPQLRPFVAHYWTVTWDLRGEPPYTQQVLPYPAVNMTFKAGRCRVAGVPRGRFHEVLDGAGRVFGVRFRPGGFRAFADGPVSALTDRFVAVEAFFGAPGARLAAEVLAADDDAAAAVLDAFLAARAPERPDPAAELVDAVVARTVEPTVLRVDALAAEFGLTVRQLQRLFAEYLGVSPKWVIRRHRLHEVAARAVAGEPVDLGVLAGELGYADQAHLSRDFAAITGVPPSRYIRAQ